ncbi:18905_t:CDS:2 [Racocetra fulgida]|uniref:18905_t:CDS:1 n=1 Tax=Racocetra fulgida TaxID=60492 RepID=A0A9N9FEI6_9GLOM|nr:18905_t:CDS:2 [Racocetra fulgida]
MEELLSETDSDINNNSFEDEVDFIDQINYTNKINYEDIEQVTNTTQVKKATSKKQKHNVNNSQSETEASTFTLTKKPSIIQKNLPKRKKDGSQVRSWIWKYFDRLTPPPDKAACGKCIVKNGKKCGHTIYTEGSTNNIKHHLLSIHGLTESSRNNIKRKTTIDQALTKFIILDNQPLSIISSESFINFIKTLDSYYELPSNIKLKEFIYQGLLITEYKLLKSDEFETVIQNNSEENEENELLHTMYGSNLQRVKTNKVETIWCLIKF